MALAAEHDPVRPLGVGVLDLAHADHLAVAGGEGVREGGRGADAVDDDRDVRGGGVDRPEGGVERRGHAA